MVFQKLPQISENKPLNILYASIRDKDTDSLIDADSRQQDSEAPFAKQSDDNWVVA